MNLTFSDRVVVVTGAAHGIGRRIAERFNDAGASVDAWDIEASELEGTRASLGPRGAIQTVDLTQSDQVEAASRDVIARRGHVDILVNNAGGVRGQVGRSVDDVPDDEWHRVVDANLHSAFYCARALVPSMKARGWGRIVTISSGAGLRASMTGIHAYASAKAGQLGLTRQLAHDLGKHGITANAVAPGFVRSNPSTEAQWKAYGPERQRQIVEAIARRRLGTPDDIASAVLFLASEQADWITGQVLSVDGGR